MPVAALRREDVHLPRIVVQFDSGRCCDPLPLVDEVVHEMAQVAGVVLGGEMLVVSQAGQGRDAVHRRIEDQLRPLGGKQVRKRLGLQTGVHQQPSDLLHALERGVAVRPEPRRRVEDVLNVRVGMLGAAHEGDRGHERPVAVCPNDLLGTETVLDGHDRRAVEAPAERVGRRLDAARLRRDDAEVELGQIPDIRCRRDARCEVVAAADTQALRVERTRMVGAASEDEHLRDGGEMRCEQAADRAGADDARPHANLVRRYCRYGSGSSSDPVTRMSTSLSVYLLPCR